MTAIGDDPSDYRLSYRSLTLVERGMLFGLIWEHREAHEEDFCVGFSLHCSNIDAQRFSRQYFEGLKKRYGRGVPPEYNGKAGWFEVEADQRLIDLVSGFTEQDFKIEDYLKATDTRTVRPITRREPIYGAMVTIGNAKYLPRLNLLTDLPDNLQRVVDLSGEEFVEELMTEDRVLAEIVEDTQLWHGDVAKRDATDQWIY